MSFPDQAPGPRRATPDAYAVSLYPNTSSIVPVDLGRYRMGDTVQVAFVLPGQSAAPVATITGPAGAITAPLTTRDGVTWTLEQFLGGSYVLGTYVTTVQMQSVQFEVVAGGDFGGGIISLLAVQNANGWQVLCQLKSGQLVMGLDPKLSPDQ